MDLCMTATLAEDQFIFTSMADPAVIVDYQGIIMRINPMAKRLLGWRMEDGPGKDLFDILQSAPRTFRNEYMDVLKKILENGSPSVLPAPIKLLSAQQKTIWASFSIAPLQDADKHIFALLIVLRDVSKEHHKIQALENALKKSQKSDKALRVSEERLRMSLKVNNASVFEDNFETGEMTCSPELFNQLGYPSHEHPTTLADMLHLIHPEDRERVMEEVSRHFAGNTPMYYAEFRIRTKSGQWSWCDGKGQVTQRTQNGEPKILLGISSDITARKLEEQKIRENEEKLRLAVDNSPIGICTIDEHGVFLFANHAYQQLMGYNEAELKLMSLFDLTSPDYLQENKKLFDNMLSGKTPGYYIEKKYIRKDGTTVDVAVHATMARDQHGRSRFALALAEDITDRKRAENILRENEESLRITLDSIGEGVICTDDTGIITRMNRAAEILTGWSLSAGTTHYTKVFNLQNPEDEAVTNNLFQEIHHQNHIIESAKQVTLISNRGVRHQITLSAAPFRNATDQTGGMVLVFKDVTEKSRIEEDLKKIQRLESIGTLAGGIAHDFNNILMGIYGNISIARERLSPHHPALQPLQQAEKSMNRATRLSTQLLTFAKGGEPVKNLVDIDKLAEEIIRFDLSGSNVRPVFHIPSGSWTMEVDKGQMQQVFSNLAINAREAMPEGGHLYISLEEKFQEEKKDKDSDRSRYIKITLRDEGIGIPKKYLSRIFDPYFSTKQTGSGLGLATAYSIISKHNGQLEARSTPGQGTTFTILLPACETRQTDPLPSPSAAMNTTETNARILIMDDEKMIRDVMSESLELLGFDVDTACDGQETIAKYKEGLRSMRPFDLLIMDLTIPGGMGGKETIKKILDLDSNAKAIVSSGYAGDPVMANYAEYGFKAIAVKPYPMNTLQETIRKVLAETTS